MFWAFLGLFTRDNLYKLKFKHLHLNLDNIDSYTVR